MARDLPAAVAEGRRSGTQWQPGGRDAAMAGRRPSGGGTTMEGRQWCGDGHAVEVLEGMAAEVRRWRGGGSTTMAARSGRHRDGGWRWRGGGSFFSATKFH